MIEPHFSRRALLTVGAGALASGAIAAARAPFRVTLLGQSLIQHDLRRTPWPGMAPLVARLRRADIVFTDLETSIEGPGAGPPTRDSEVLHVADPAVIDCLRSFGVDLVTTANNHAWDLGTGGILSALAALDRRGVTHAGSGATLAAAFAPATRAGPHGAVALVAAAAGAIRDGAAATADRPGVAELRRRADGSLEPDDVDRMLAAIGVAKARGAVVIACLHNHYWEPDPATTPPWQRRLARACVDAGAAIFVAHGPPLLQGIERYRGAPLFHGLGSFIFQTRKAEAAYGPAAWQSLIVETEFARGRLASVRLQPVILNATGFDPANELATRGCPTLAAGRQGADILAHVRRLSAAL